VKYIPVGNLLINASLVAWAKRHEGGVVEVHYQVHYAAPNPKDEVGLTQGAPGEVCEEVASQCSEYYQGDEAEAVWKALSECK
jgi:hypothetical protein